MMTKEEWIKLQEGATPSDIGKTDKQVIKELLSLTLNYQRSIKIADEFRKKYVNLTDKVSDLVFNSDTVFIEGVDSKTTIRKIIDLL